MTAPVQSPSPALAAAPGQLEPLVVVVTRPRKQRPHDPWLLLGLTLLAGALRLIYLDRPTLWHEEIATVSRLAGIDTDGGHGGTPTPVIARLAPAIAGTLLPAAVYWLARRLVPRRAALAAAAFIACSAWTLSFSRQAQAHAPLWLLSVAALAGAFALARSWSARLLAAAFVLAVGAWLFAAQTPPADETGPARSAAAFLSGIIIPTAEQRPYIPAPALRWMMIGVALILLPLAVGLLPWPKRWRAPASGADPAAPRWMLAALLAAWVALSLILRRPSFCVPAVAIMVAVLLMRIPTWPLRGLAVAVVCALNVFAAAVPVLAQVEPPVDQVARDVWLARHPGGPVRTFVQHHDGSADRGGGTIFNDVGRYYLAVAAGGAEPIPTVAGVASAEELIRQIDRLPHLERIIVWDHFNQARGVPPETLEQRLPGTWVRTSEGYRAAWGPSWQYRYTARRREYVRNLAMDAESDAH